MFDLLVDIRVKEIPVRRKFVLVQFKTLELGCALDIFLSIFVTFSSKKF